MNFDLYFEQPNLHHIRIEMHHPPSGNVPVEIFQSKWRPGRYELSSYAENIIDVRAFTEGGSPLSITQTAYNAWTVAPSGTKSWTLEYKYFANTPDAGGSFFDENLAYFNGVNLLFYTPDQIEEPSSFTVHLPATYKIACGLPRQGQTFHAKNYHQLVDAPLMASENIQHKELNVAGISHHIWFHGNVHPDWDRISTDFIGFGEAQMALFGEFPVVDYHYLFLIHDKHAYHGVEHYNSTMITLGPSYKLMHPSLYEELLGISCHELFHTWNVKALRPADMRPYRYNEENYSRLHYVTEGVTTYYGDLMLMKGGVWDLEEYLKVMNSSLLHRHYRNSGHLHITLEHASYNSWVNGYKANPPNRKISFYTKGALVAFILDFQIRKATQNNASLDDLMRNLYDQFGKTEKGYNREDYQNAIEKITGESYTAFFQDYISGTKPLEPALAEAADYFGLQFVPKILISDSIRRFGFRADAGGAYPVIKQVWEGGPAESAGLRPDDEIIAVNNIKCPSGKLNLLLKHFEEDSQVRLSLFRNAGLKHIDLKQVPEYFNPKYKLIVNEFASPAQLENQKNWMRVSVKKPHHSK